MNSYSNRKRAEIKRNLIKAAEAYGTAHYENDEEAKVTRLELALMRAARAWAKCQADGALSVVQACPLRRADDVT